MTESTEVNAVADLQSIAGSQGVQVIVHMADHIELRGLNRVHYYPKSKRKTAYLPATKERHINVSPEYAVQLANDPNKQGRPPTSIGADWHKSHEFDKEYTSMLKDIDPEPLPVGKKEESIDESGGWIFPSSTVIRQRKVWSAIETVTSTAVGFALSMVANHYIIPWMFGVTVPLVQNLELTSIYTVLSLARGYFVRRGFNRLPD